MKPYLISAAAGLLIGAIYGLLHVRSPAPPIIALVGLLGILVGEQIPPYLRQLFSREPAQVSWLSQQVRPHMFGELPQGSNCSGSNCSGSNGRTTDDPTGNPT
ncbi:XapX domain-containing protein [Solimonas flava]|uniref:XapX domain-containing protein n=1 Tax=Solimonas flava TaxID=415849 RepID=UPI0004046994|nr:XapX domain-containing protein [Solimonas flava]